MPLCRKCRLLLFCVLLNLDLAQPWRCFYWLSIFSLFTIATFCRENIQQFIEKGFTTLQFFGRCAFFSILWMMTNFTLIYSLRLLDTTVVMSLFSCTVTIIYLLSWVVLHQQFVGIRVSSQIIYLQGTKQSSHSCESIFHAFNRKILALFYVCLFLCLNDIKDVIVFRLQDDLETKLAISFNIIFFYSLPDCCHNHMRYRNSAVSLHGRSNETANGCWCRNWLWSRFRFRRLQGESILCLC